MFNRSDGKGTIRVLGGSLKPAQSACQVSEAAFRSSRRSRLSTDLNVCHREGRRFMMQSSCEIVRFSMSSHVHTAFGPVANCVTQQFALEPEYAHRSRDFHRHSPRFSLKATDSRRICCDSPPSPTQSTALEFFNTGATGDTAPTCRSPQQASPSRAFVRDHTVARQQPTVQADPLCDSRNRLRRKSAAHHCCGPVTIFLGRPPAITDFPASPRRMVAKQLHLLRQLADTPLCVIGRVGLAPTPPVNTFSTILCRRQL